MTDILDAIKVAVGPVVMISAAGMMCLALYNRLAVIVARVRAFNKERLDERARIEKTGDMNTARTLEARLTLLDAQVNQLLTRARLVRGALAFLLTTIFCMLLCSASLALSALFAPAVNAAVTFFALGIILAMCGVICALRELARAIDPVAVEHSSLYEPDQPKQ